MLNVSDPKNLVGLIIGASVVFLFSGLAINAVSRAAGAIVFEVRRQFRENPGIMEGTGKPEYGKVVDICTRDSLRELATPGLLAVLAPIAVGFGLGVGALGAYLAGAIAAGTLMAVFLANSGGAWDNAKKIVEDGAHGGKGSPAHEATIIGDTVGDPFKDTAGPAINPLHQGDEPGGAADRPGGRVAVDRRRRQRRRARPHRAGLPPRSVFTLVFAIEGWACWLMVLPVFLLSASLGGLAAGYFKLRRKGEGEALRHGHCPAAPARLPYRAIARKDTCPFQGRHLHRHPGRERPDMEQRNPRQHH